MTTSPPPLTFNNTKHCEDEIIRRVGKNIVFAMPLALGKSYDIINELYRRAKADDAIQLTILTALALEKPGWSSDLERRKMHPISWQKRTWTDKSATATAAIRIWANSLNP